MTRIPRALRLHVPLPPSDLSPNKASHQHWRYRQQAAQTYRELCAATYRVQLAECGDEAPFVRARLLLRFGFCGKRRVMDCDGALGAAKPAIDALVDVGLLRDDGPAVVPEMVATVAVKHGRTCQCGGAVIVTLEEVQA